MAARATLPLSVIAETSRSGLAGTQPLETIRRTDCIEI
jgi:hypothetical protein